MQRNWASMWLMSQDQSLWPDQAPEPIPVPAAPTAAEPVSPPVRSQSEDKPATPAPVALKGEDFSPSALAESLGLEAPPLRAWPTTEPKLEPADELEPSLSLSASANDHHSNNHHSIIDHSGEDRPNDDRPNGDRPNDDRPTDDHPGNDHADDPSLDAWTKPDAFVDHGLAAEILPEEISGEVPAVSPLQGFAALRATLRSHRADLYLAAAVFFAALALMWPDGNPPQRASLSPVERVLVAVGIADAPAPAVHHPGDPAVEVWVDPHTALYYCPGAEQYGKTADGRVSTQHDAQMDRFQPAGRTPCE
jgi:hypothetical protein